MKTMNPVVQAEAGETAEASGAAPKKRGPKVNLLNIVRGRLPLALVACIRFHEPADKSNNDLAKKYGTSVGKIFDIRKGRNFGYVTADYKVTDEDLKAAEAWAKSAEAHGGDTAAIMAAVDKLTKASADEAAAQAAKITEQRSKGPRGPRKPKDEGAKSTGSADAAALLS